MPAERPPDSLGRPSIRKAAPEGGLSFAESVSLSSTGSADLRLPPTAFGSGFDLLALRARRRWESRRGQVPAQEVRTTKRTQFATIQFSTFPQQGVQLVETRNRRSVTVSPCLICRARRASTTGSSRSSGRSHWARSSTSEPSQSAFPGARRSSSRRSLRSGSSSSCVSSVRRRRQNAKRQLAGRSARPTAASGIARQASPPARRQAARSRDRMR
jgi:hypothetical protein